MLFGLSFATKVTYDKADCSRAARLGSMGASKNSIHSPSGSHGPVRSNWNCYDAPHLDCTNPRRRRLVRAPTPCKAHRGSRIGDSTAEPRPAPSAGGPRECHPGSSVHRYRPRLHSCSSSGARSRSRAASHIHLLRCLAEFDTGSGAASRTRTHRLATPTSRRRPGRSSSTTCRGRSD